MKRKQRLEPSRSPTFKEPEMKTKLNKSKTLQRKPRRKVILEIKEKMGMMSGKPREESLVRKMYQQCQSPER